MKHASMTRRWPNLGRSRWLVACLTAVSLFADIWSHAVSADSPWESLNSPSQASLRGLSAIDRTTAWACGSKGTILRTIDGGAHWQTMSIPGLESTELRSIHAWSSDRVVVATAGQPAVIYQSRDAGKSWNKTYEIQSPQGFIDGLRFDEELFGLAFSDPVDGQLLVLKSEDGGDRWQPIEASKLPAIEAGEAGFAASNSSLLVLGNSAWIGLGGGEAGPSHIFRTADRGATWQVHEVSFLRRAPSAGIFSVSIDAEGRGLVVGGDYQKESSAENNIALTDDGGKRWRTPQRNHPGGFRSCAIWVPLNQSPTRRLWLACGPNGCDGSFDREYWFPISQEGFHAMFPAKDGTVWACGSQGRIARLNTERLPGKEP